MKNNSFKRLIASAAIAVLLACNIGDAGTSVVSYAAAATTEQAAEEKTEKAEKAETSREKEVRKEESETKETPREVTEDSGTDETIKETPEAPAEETAKEETEEKASEAAAGEQEIKEETEEETDQAQDASAAPSEEEEEEDIAVPAGSTSLTGMIESIQVGPKTGQSTTDVPRDDKVSVSVSYKISDSKVGEAQANPEWEYDLTDMVNDPDGILSSISGAGGEIMQGGSSRGTYRIEDNKVILTITDLNWLNAQESNVSGTFDFSLNLDADKVKDRGGYTFNFPGGGDFHIDFEEVKVSGEKKVGTRYNQQATSDGSNFDVTSEKNDDGTYTLYYSARVKPNATLSGLSMTDTLTGSQTLVAGSIQLNGTAIPSDYISTSGDGFTADLGAYLASTGSSVKKDTDYTVTYQTTIPESALKSGQANTAAFTYAGKTDSFTTNITPVSKKNYDSLVKKSMSADGDGAGAVITYTITVNPEHADMAGMTISDTMTDLQLLEGDITISPAVNGMTTLTPDARFSDDELSTNSYEVFKYTFPSDGTFTDTYTITYKTKIPESSGSIEGKQKVENTVKVEDEDGEGTSHVEDQFTFPGEPYGVGKEFSSWDTDNNVINWTITLTVEEGTTLSNISIQDIPYYGLDQWNINRDAEVLWDEITVTDTDENAVAFTPDPANKSIKFDQVDKTIIIHVPTKSPVSITEQADFWAKNTAQVYMNGKKGKTAEAVKRYVSQTVDMSKNVSYDEASKEWTWTVVINPTNAEFDEDYVPYFTDQLPEGMELADSTITVGCNGGGHTNAQGQVIWGTHEDNPAKVTADVQNGTIQPIDLTKGYPDIYNAWPTGISGMKYTITYKTKLSADEIARIKGNTEEQTYNNVASVTDGTNVKNTAEKETTYKYKFLEKSDNSPEKLDKDIIEYSIVANPDALTLNGGDSLTVSDVLNTSVELVTNSIKVKGKDGADLADTIVGYHDDTREITITIPDETYAKITFKVTAANLNDRKKPEDKTTYTNTANLKGQGEYSDSVSKDHRVLDHSATITGEKHAISLHKVDQFNLGKDLAGAKFSLYKCSLDADYKIVGEELIGTVGGHVTDRSGIITFKKLSPYTLYYWVEEEAPEGYETTSELPHYFVMFDADENAAIEAANQERAKVIDNGVQNNNTFEDGSPVIVNTIKDNYTWIVTNLAGPEDPDPVAIMGSKTLTGRDMNTGEEFEFVLEALTEDAPMPAASATVTVEGNKATTKVSGAKDGEAAAFNFGSITFKKDGIYSYKVTETKGSDADVDYDDTIFNIEVNVSKNEETNKRTADLTVNGSADTEIAFSNTYEEKTTDVSISKQVLGQGKELAGAELTVTNEKGDVVDSWTSDGSQHEIENLTNGKYTLTETSAPEGYEVAESIEFEIKDGKLVESEDAKNGVVTMADAMKKTDVSISKVEAAGGEELKGAELTVTKVKDIDGTEISEVIESWTSNGSVHEITGLTDGTYTLKEESAPDGYKKAETITFTIKDGKLVTEGNDAIVEGVVTMKDEQYKTDVSISKQDLGQGTELAGATLSLIKAGQEAAPDDWTWESDGSVHVVKGLTDGTYTLKEESAPDGYKKAESITFEIKNGELVTEGNNAIVEGVVTMKDEQYKGGVSVSKQVLGQGKELAGAELTVTNEKGDVVDSWTSDGSQHEIENLTDGKYTLTETSAPEGYEVAESIEFEIKDGKLVESEDAKNGVVTMADAMKKTDVSISKVEAAGGEELEGAELTVTKVKDIDGTEISEVIESWTSDGTVHKITGLTDGTYELEENQAPLGYQTAEKITFTIKDGKLAEDENAKDGVVTMTDELYKTDVKISKVDVANSQELKGATLSLTKAGQEAAPDDWTWESDGSVHVVKGLTDGTYTLTEESAPDGYKKAESITFEIKNGELVTEGNDAIVEGVVTMKDEQYKGGVSVSKQVLGQGKELAGAELTVTNEKGDVVDSWTSNGSQHEIENLTDGKYTLTETSAPEGYEVAESIEFEIKDGKLVESEDAKNGVVTMADAMKKTDVSISKVEAAGGEELEGAELTVTKVKDIDGTEISEVIESWTSDGTVHKITGLTDGTYELEENQAPLGYQTAEKITFTIKDGKLAEDENAKDGVVTMTDELYKTDVKISKVDAANSEELKGAQLTVTKVKDAAGEEVSEEIDSWTSEGKVHEITGLTDGTYELVEDQAPLGYKTAEKITFTIKDGKLAEDENAKDGVVTMTDELNKTDVKISKVEAAGGEELEGAKLTVTKVKDAAGEEVSEEIDSWTSNGTVHEVKDLTDGTYELVEDQAPLGYQTAEKITFTIKDGKLAEDENAKEGVVTMTDELYKTDVKISKVDAANSEELKGAKLTVTKVKDAAGEEVSEEIDSWTSEGKVHEITGLTDGTYELVEDQAPLGYKTAEKITFTIKNGKLAEDENAKDGVVTMTDELFETDVKISKVEAAGGEELAGAQLTVTKVKDAAGEEVSEEIDSWTSNGTVHEVKDLTDGTYELVEDQAPLGYQTAEKITFTIKDGKLAEDENAKDGVVTMEDALYTTDVSISKQILGQGDELKGAELTLTRSSAADGTVVDEIVEEWTSDGTVHEVKDLTDGTYVLTETSAPEGYKVAESITFVIKDGKLEASDDIIDGVVTMKDELYKGGVSISKQDLGSGAELKGAELKVTDKDGNVIDSWTSDGSQHEIKDLVDGTYTLTETSAPYGYKVSEEITFTMKDGKLVEDENAKDGVVTMKDEQYKTTVKVSKVELGSGEELAGAVLTLTNNDTGATVTWTSDGTAKEIENLIDGKYTLTEDQAPLGYFKAESIDFEISKGKIVGQDENTVVMEDQFTSIGISKTDITGEKELAGAHLQILDSDGFVVAEWDSREDGYVTVTHLAVGEEHTLRETVAPDGYTITTDHTFIINEDKTCTTTTKVSKDGIMLVQDDLTSVKVSKVDIADGEEIEGAHIQILDEEGNVAAEWDSTGEAVEVTGLLTGVTYTLHETVAPDGYTIASDTTFTIDEKGNVTTTATVSEDGVMLVEDAQTVVYISKVDIAGGEELEGAHIQILDEEGNVVTEWDSTKKAEEITGLKTGVTYTLRETVAPEGYSIATDTTFTIDEKGKVTTTGSVSDDGVILIEDALTSVKISKVDIADGKELEGAHIQILDKDGRIVAEWDSTKKAQEIIGLQTGVTYTLRETVAPYGYYLTSDTTFILNADGTVNTEATKATVKDGVILVEDKITETKIVKTDEDYNPISGAKLRIEEGKGDAIASWTSSADGYTIIQGLQPGVTYFLVEGKAPAGYKKAETIAFTIDAKGNIKIKSGKGKVKDGILVMVDKKASGTAKHNNSGSKGGKKRGARTGDDNNFMLWIAMAAAAAGGILGLVARKRRNTK